MPLKRSSNQTWTTFQKSFSEYFHTKDNLEQQ
jgi:hypothetical protein